MGIIFNHGRLMAQQTSFSGNGDKPLRRRSVAAYMAGILKTVAHAILSPYAVYLYLCTCTGVGAHTGWPSECSAEELYNNNNNNKQSLRLSSVLAMIESPTFINTAVFRWQRHICWFIVLGLSVSEVQTITRYGYKRTLSMYTKNAEIRSGVAFPLSSVICLISQLTLRQTMGSNCARAIDVTYGIDRRPTTTETRVKLHQGDILDVSLVEFMYIVYSSHARWSYRRPLGFLLLWACVQCHVWRQLLEHNYFPSFVDSTAAL